MGRKRVKVDMELMKKQYMQGMNLRQIGKYHGISQTTVLKRFQEISFETRKLDYIFKD